MQNSEPPTASVDANNARNASEPYDRRRLFRLHPSGGAGEATTRNDRHARRQPWIDFRRRPLGVLHVGQFHFCSHAKS